MKKNRYFSHDSNARYDNKIILMRAEYGNRGYGIFWIIVECLREQDDLKFSLTPFTFLVLSKATEEDVDFIEKFINDCIYKYELFSLEDGCFYSQSLIDRMNIITEKSKRMSEISKIRWDKEKQKKEAVEQKKEQKKKEKVNHDDVVEKIWSLYPRKEGKGTAVKKIKLLLNKYSENELIQCIERYKKKIEMNQIDKQFIKQGSTFFNTGFIDFLDENYEEEVINKPTELKVVTYVDRETGEVKRKYV